MTKNLKVLVPSCSLTNEEMIERKAFLQYSLAEKVSEVKELKDGYDLIFKESIEYSKELLDFINFERNCCANFTFSLIFEPHNQATHLQIYGSKSIKKELERGFSELGLIDMNLKKEEKSASGKLGLLGIGLCGLCCVFPIIGALIGISSFSLIAFYMEKLGIFVLVLALIFFVYDYFKKRQSEKSCEISCGGNCDCKTNFS